MSERRDIYLRVHTAKHTEGARKKRELKKASLPKWPERLLIFDTETRTDVHQQLMFGLYRICRLVGDRYLCEAEGIVYAEGLAKDELNQIGTFVLNTFSEAEVKQFPPPVKLQIHRSFPEFMRKVFWPAVRKGWGIVGFNLGFDISRLSLGWRRSRKGGFSLILSKQLDYKSRTWKSHPYRPEINLEAKDARTAFITRRSPRFRKDEWPNPGRFLDVRTLLFSLFDKHLSLDQWCAEFQKKGYVIDRKLSHEPSGRVSQAELHYCRQDVKITQQLLNAAKQEFDKHPLSDLLPDRAYSPASIAKAYMREMNIIKPLEKFKVPDEVLGISMQPYFGGRAEVHIRRTRVPVMRLDFVSQYCTVNTLLHNWEILTAASVNFPDDTKGIRKLLSMIANAPEKCFQREFWPLFRFFALVKPDHDILPVRAPYNEKKPDKLNIGVNYFSSEQPVWLAGPDIIASILLNNGKIPNVLKAIRVVPIGKQEDLKTVKLLGKIQIDPVKDDFYKNVVEQKEANKADATLKKGLKCIGNAGAYGPLVELNEQNEGKDIKLNVYSGEHYHQQKIRERESPGPFYFPPVASLITSGGRLLLALAEKSVVDAGGKILFCDTDSLCIVANEKGGFLAGLAHADFFIGGADIAGIAPISCLSRDAVLKISERFATLNPYSFAGTILKVEDINYEDGDPAKPFRDLYGYAISAKRYCLFEGKHVRKIIDAKAHGIGYLMSPLRGKRDTNADQFVVEFWQKVLQNEGISFKVNDPEWLDRPAMMQIPVSSPAVLGRLKEFCKPRDFVLAPVVRDEDPGVEEQSDKPILITRFTKNSEEWENAIYYNVRTGEPCRITTGESEDKNVIPVRSYRSVLNSYVNNSESKFNGPDGKQCWVSTRGILQRMHVVAGEHRYCGKEVNRKLEQGPVDHEIEFKCKVYENGRVAADPDTLRQLAGFSEREIRKRTGMRRDTIRLIRHGKGVKRSTYLKVVNFLKEQAS